MQIISSKIFKIEFKLGKFLNKPKSSKKLNNNKHTIRYFKTCINIQLKVF